MDYGAAGHRYEGSWFQNKKHGRGTFFYADGNVYEGDWQMDERHGRGTMVYYPQSVLEEKYEGEWFHGKKHGRGRYTYKQTDNVWYYEGMWEENRREGTGLLKFRDGSQYEGNFHNEQMHGKGTFLWAGELSRTKYIGDWKENKREGFGMYFDEKGGVYKGEFYQNKKHGRGEYVNRDGTQRYFGYWDNDTKMGAGNYGGSDEGDSSSSSQNACSFHLEVGKYSESEVKDMLNRGELIEGEEESDEILSSRRRVIKLKVRGY